MTIRQINYEQITSTIAKLCISANINPDESIRTAICSARQTETSSPAKNALNMIIENMEIAEAERMPMCQDTGMVVVFMEIGRNVHITGDVDTAVHEGVRLGYKNGYFRASVVGDPLTRENTKDNTPAVIHYNIVEGSKVKITVMPKGFGSENKSALKMLTPSEGAEGIVDFVIDTVRNAGSSPCPPIIVGVGVGGTMEKAALLSKQALNVDIFEENPTRHWAGMEKDLLEKINGLDIGVSGFKGTTTALAVNILAYPTHIAGLPVAVNIGCHVARHKSAVL